MSIEGIWTGEIYGPFEWEPFGVFIFDDGRVAGGDDRQYSFGCYCFVQDKLKAALLTRYYGQPRTMFGEAQGEYRVTIDGVWEGGQIVGVISRPDASKFDLRIRLTKRENLGVDSCAWPNRKRADGAPTTDRNRSDIGDAAEIIALAAKA